MHAQIRTQSEELHSGVARARGAARAAWRALRARAALTSALLLATLVGAGCASQQRTEVLGVAAVDLACDDIAVSELSGGNYAASGCGRGAVYAQLCDYNGCRWGRLRHGHEQQVAASMMPPTAGREILPAPPPEQRMVLPAPAPGGMAAPPPAPPPPGAPPAPDPNVAPLQDSSLGPGAGPSDPNLAPVPLSAGVLSDPYQTEVPAQPVAQSVLYPPPAPLVEVQPAPPLRTYVWIGGYWWWGPSNWVWVPGYWCPPYHGYAYVPGRWSWSAGYWHYGPGGWARPGTTVIVHNRLPPRPSTIASVRAFTPHRVVSTGSVASSRGLAPVRVAPSNYSPRSSPLYPYSNKRATQPVPAGGYRYESGRAFGASPSVRGGGDARYGSGSVGRVVTPDSAVRTPSGFNERRSAPSTYRSPSYDSRSSGRSFDSGGGRAYGGGSTHSSGSWSGGGGGGGGGGRMAPVRVSPGGGGGGGGGGRRR